MTTATDIHDTGRVLDWTELKQQIGMMTVFGISGGRAVRMGESTIDLPVSSGYVVRITIEANDTYTVTRLMKRSGREFVKGAVSDVYCDQISDVAYAASCYKNVEFGS